MAQRLTYRSEIKNSRLKLYLPKDPKNKQPTNAGKKTKNRLFKINPRDEPTLYPMYTLDLPPHPGCQSPPGLLPFSSTISHPLKSPAQQRLSVTSGMIAGHTSRGNSIGALKKREAESRLRYLYILHDIVIRFNHHVTVDFCKEPTKSVHLLSQILRVMLPIFRSWFVWGGFIW